MSKEFFLFQVDLVGPADSILLSYLVQVHLAPKIFMRNTAKDTFTTHDSSVRVLFFWVMRHIFERHLPDGPFYRAQKSKILLFLFIYHLLVLIIREKISAFSIYLSDFHVRKTFVLFQK